MKTLLTVLIMVSSAVTIKASADDEEPLIVPKPVMSFIMQCQSNKQRDDLVPVYRKEISAESGTTSQHVSLLAIDELQASLRSAIESDDVTGHIMDRIKEEFDSNSKPEYRQNECPPTANIINIDVPPQELEAFHLRMERVMQQNNNVMLQLINEMISTKFSTLEDNLSKLIRRRRNELNQKLDLILQEVLPQEAEEIPDIPDPPILSHDDEEVVTEPSDSKIGLDVEDTPEVEPDREPGQQIVQGNQTDEESETVVELDSIDGEAVNPEAESEPAASNLQQLLQGPPIFTSRRKTVLQ